MNTAIVILNWNTVDYLRKFLPPLIESVKGLDAEVIVADSASTDGSMEMMASEFPEIRRICLDRNYGFTGGYNRALSQVDADLYVLLNSDIEVSKGWLRPLMETMEKEPGLGACAPKLHSLRERDMFEYAGAAGGMLDCIGLPFCRGRIPGNVEKDRGQYDSSCGILWVSGACLMVRRSVFWEMGGLDDRFFAHFEEIDLCWRMQLAGYSVKVIPESTVWHIGGGTLPSSSPRKLKFNFRNNLLMLQNNLALTLAHHKAGEDNMKEDTARKIAVKACRKAKRLIFYRMTVDGLAAAAYLARLDTASFKAVIAAHMEFRSLGRNTVPEEVSRHLLSHPGVKVRGLYRKSIVLQTLLHGKNTAGKIDWNDQYFK
ncbi:MAG: glycosyltransferase family 2 protein [Bacteroidales bacterium]|nr:glycosyltransferase family 2 protein [Bacteroidales bacterium]